MVQEGEQNSQAALPESMEEATASPPRDHVQDSDYETDEECLVHVSVSGILQEELSSISRDKFSFVDIQSSQPLVTIGGHVFVGTHEDTIGSSVFFTQSPNDRDHDQVFSRKSPTQVSYLAATRKKLQLRRIFLKKKPMTES